ncbi:MAG: hypothetical protein QNJ42_19100 [Crocosphaera sp.]|nr:hypothetical protein [Crocosphaera sp.]
MSQFDLAGSWQYLGTITPQFEQWQRFPISTASFSPLIRLTFYDDFNFNKIGSFGYLRVAYNFPDTFFSKWSRIYPNFDRSVLSFPIPKELLLTSNVVTRHFEIMKRNKYNRPGWVVHDTQWSCAIESLELINLTNEDQILLNQVDTLEQVATIIQEQITQGD